MSGHVSGVLFQSSPLVLGSGHLGHFWCPPTSWLLQGTAVQPFLWPCGPECPEHEQMGKPEWALE